MGYDPMRYVPRTGDYIMQGANQMASAITSIPEALKRDEQYKKAEAAYESERDLMTDAYSGTNSLLQNLGVDKTVRAPKEGEGKEQYLEYIVSEISPLVRDESGGISNDKLSMVKERIGQIGLGGNQQVQESLQTRNLLQQYGPMAAQGAEQPQTQDQFAGRGTIMNEDVPSTQMPSADEVPTQNDPTAFDPMAAIDNRRKTYYDLLKSGNVPNQLFLEKMTELDGKEFDIKKAELDLEKARIAERKQRAAEDVINKAGSGPVYKDDVQAADIKPLDVYDNPDDYSVSTRNYPREFAPRGGSGRQGGSGSENRDKPPASWVQYKEIEAQRDKLRENDGYTFDQAEYDRKSTEALQHQLSYLLEVNGQTYNEAQKASRRVLDIPVTFTEDVVPNYDDEGRKFMEIPPIDPITGKLNAASPKVIEALLSGETASSILQFLEQEVEVPYRRFFDTRQYTNPRR